MQKTFTPDALGGLQVKNIGQQMMYLIENDHEPIIDRETWIRVQEIKGVPLPEYMRSAEVEAILSDEANSKIGMKMC